MLNGYASASIKEFQKIEKEEKTANKEKQK